MDGETKNWWMFAKWSDEYEWGVDEYVKKAFATKSQGNQICCPCELCHYRFWRHEGVVRDHLICNGFVPRTDKLSDLGIDIQRAETILDNDEGSNPNESDNDIVGLLHDARDAFREGPNDEAKKFLRLVEDGQEELYPSSKNHSKVSFMIRLFILKCDHKLTNAAFGDILELIREVLPDAKLPTSFNEAKSVLKVLGLDYTKIDACPNDCMIYWEEHENATSCHVCKTPRWKSKDKENEIQNENEALPFLFNIYSSNKIRISKSLPKQRFIRNREKEVLEGHTKLVVKKQRRILPKWMLWSLPNMKMVITATTLTTK